MLVLPHNICQYIAISRSVCISVYLALFGSIMYRSPSKVVSVFCRPTIIQYPTPNSQPEVSVHKLMYTVAAIDLTEVCLFTDPLWDQTCFETILPRYDQPWTLPFSHRIAMLLRPAQYTRGARRKLLKYK